MINKSFKPLKLQNEVNRSVNVCLATRFDEFDCGKYEKSNQHIWINGKQFQSNIQ